MRNSALNRRWERLCWQARLAQAPGRTHPNSVQKGLPQNPRVAFDLRRYLLAVTGPLDLVLRAGSDLMRLP
ncbi:MAG: hypothetical protein ACI9OU_000319 [Candidatus Promineifilaceae bacterium]|jgi:hypothetical protein